MARELSRALDLNLEECVKNVGMGRFDLVLIASERAREIRRQNKESNKFEHIHSAMTALIEIQEGKVGKEYLNKIKFDKPGDRHVDRSARYK